MAVATKQAKKEASKETSGAPEDQYDDEEERQQSEEVDLDEANFEIKNGKLHISKADYAKKPKEYKGKRNGKPTLMALDPKTGSTTSFEVVLEEVELDEKADLKKIDTGQLEKQLGLLKIGKPTPRMKDTAKRIRDELKSRGIKAEELDLDEDNMDLMRKAAKGAMQTIKFKDGKLKMDSFTASGIMAVYDKVNPKNKVSIEKMINSGTKAQIMKLQDLAMKASKGGRREEVEFDEARQLKNPKKEVLVVKGGKVVVINKKDAKEYLNKGWELAEEVGLDEDSFNIGDKVKVVPKAKGSKPFSGKITGKLKNGKHEVQVYNKNVSHMDIMVHELVKEEVNIDESARSDAMRAIRKDKDLGKRSDVEDDDDSATDADIKGASKNIIMQMRKAISMRGNFVVEFGDKKKIKIPEKIAQAVQNKYNSFRKPKDKEKFQAKVAMSYKSMLSALKENTILGWIGKKIQERKEILEASNRWELGGKKFSLINDKGTYILVTQGTGEEKKLKSKTTQDATQELVKKGYRES